MTTSTFAYVGFYVKAKRPDNSGSILVNACPKHGEMETVFCPTCGLQTVPQSKFIECLRSIAEIIYDPDADWVKESVSAEDVEWIQQNVTFIQADQVNGDEDYDYFFIGDDYVYVDDVSDGMVCDIDISEEVCMPDPDEVRRVMKIVGYQSHSVHFGMLIQVC